MVNLVHVGLFSLVYRTKEKGSQVNVVNSKYEIYAREGRVLAK